MRNGIRERFFIIARALPNHLVVLNSPQEVKKVASELADNAGLTPKERKLLVEIAPFIWRMEILLQGSDSAEARYDA